MIGFLGKVSGFILKTLKQVGQSFLDFSVNFETSIKEGQRVISCIPEGLNLKEVLGSKVEVLSHRILSFALKSFSCHNL